MIECLEGLQEIIHYGDSLGLRLFHNKESQGFPEHWHTGIEMIMPVSKKYKIVVGKQEYSLEEGDVAVINSGVLHKLEAPSFGERIILQFSASLLYSLKELETLMVLLPPVICLSPEDREGNLYETVKTKMDAIVREYDRQETYAEAVIYAKLIELFVAIGRSNTLQIYRQGGQGKQKQCVKQKEYMERVMNVCSYINQHYQENISLEEIAAVSGFSKFHFTRIFKQCMDVTFYEYLNQKRIMRAEELLSASNASITNIAMDSGFSSISAFNRTFKTLKECSPSEYRKKLSAFQED